MNTEALRRAHAETTPGEADYAKLRALLVAHLVKHPDIATTDALYNLPQSIALAHKEVPALIDRIEALEAENARLATLAKANNDLARIEMTHRKQLAFQRAELANAMEALTSQYGHRLPADFLLALTQMLMRHGDTARAALGEPS